MAFTGSCHCGAFSYTVEGDVPTEALACNCSICRRKGTLLHFTAASNLTLSGSRDGLTGYRFNKKAIDHLFCDTCGCTLFGEGAMPDGTKTVAINLRCADLDLDALEIHHFDGASA